MTLTPFAPDETDVLALAQEIKKLYASMDNSLRFPAETAPKADPV